MGADFRESDLRTLLDAGASHMPVFKALTIVPGEPCFYSSAAIDDLESACSTDG